MNMLVACEPQILVGANGLAWMKINARDTGNALDEAAMASLSAKIDIQA